jgi:predicted TPR repeat methyltransferase
MDMYKYWEDWYSKGNTSGKGSVGKLAEYKTTFINNVIQTYNIQSMIDFGCGDGVVMKGINCKSYLGVDLSLTAIQLCSTLSPEKEFVHLDKFDERIADMTISLDVIFHLTDNLEYIYYMDMLFNSASKLVVIYSTNLDYRSHPQFQHIRHRRFSSNIPKGWELKQYYPNPYPSESDSDFYLYGNIN